MLSEVHRLAEAVRTSQGLTFMQCKVSSSSVSCEWRGGVLVLISAQIRCDSAVKMVWKEILWSNISNMRVMWSSPLPVSQQWQTKRGGRSMGGCNFWIFLLLLHRVWPKMRMKQDLMFVSLSWMFVLPDKEALTHIWSCCCLYNSGDPEQGQRPLKDPNNTGEESTTNHCAAFAALAQFSCLCCY